MDDKLFLEESETVEYLRNFLKISTNTTNGELEGEDEKLVQKFQNLHHLFHGHHLALTICAHFLRENIEKLGRDVSSTISDLLAKFIECHNKPGTTTTTMMVTHWSKYKRQDDDSGVETILSTFLVEIIFEHIRKNFQYDGQLSLKLLGYLAICENVHINLQTCFLMFHGREIEQNEKSGHHHHHHPHHHKKVDTSNCENDLEDLKKLKFLLTILKRYYLIQIEGNKSEENFKLSTTIKLAPIVQICLRHNQQETQDWSYVFDLINLFSEPEFLFSQKYLPYFNAVHGTLKEFFWPETGYRHSLHFAAAIILNWSKENGADAHKILVDVYEYFTTKLQMNQKETEGEDERDFENFHLCKILMIYLDCEGNGKESGFIFPAEIDNSHLFSEMDDLCRIKRSEFLDWVLEQTVQFYPNELIQHFAINILLHFSKHCAAEMMQRERSKKIETWINKFNKKILRGNLERLFVVTLTESPLKVLQIGGTCEIFSSVEILQMAINMMKASVDCEGDAKCCWFLQEAFYLTKPSPICVWEEHNSDDLDDIQDVCEVFVEHGMTTFVHMLTELEKNYRQDQRLDPNFFNFLETIQSTAFFPDCVTTLLESTEFFEELKKLFDAIVEGIEAQKDHENIRTICHILVFWCSLVSDSDNEHHGTAVSIIEELKNFSERFSEQESAVANAFDSEMHWHRGFREQGRRTSDKILDTFMASRPESATDYVYQLAKSLKNTMNQKKGWRLVSSA